MRPTVLLLAKAAISAKPQSELKALAERLALTLSGYDVTFALSEQGSPSLRDRLAELAAMGVAEIVIAPVMVPMEPGFPAWIKRAVHYWLKGRDGQLPVIRISAAPAAHTDLLVNLLDKMVDEAEVSDVVQENIKLPDSSVIPAQKHRVLVCAGGACNDAGAGQIWSHLRAEQDRLKLRETGEGMMSCKTSCLGPCNLAPVVQVWPDGTTYCGVDECAVDEIIGSHIQNDVPVSDHRYTPDGKKQKLRMK